MYGFKNVEINNFRGIDHLEIDDFPKRSERGIPQIQQRHKRY